MAVNDQRGTLSKLHPVLMIPAVLVLWFFGVAICVATLMSMNIGGAGEFGTGLIYIALGIVIALVGTTLQVTANLRLWRKEHRA